jgi:hypothetical protein
MYVYFKSDFYIIMEVEVYNLEAYMHCWISILYLTRGRSLKFRVHLVGILLWLREPILTNPCQRAEQNNSRTRASEISIL